MMIIYVLLHFFYCVAHFTPCFSINVCRMANTLQPIHSYLQARAILLRQVFPVRTSRAIVTLRKNISSGFVCWSLFQETRNLNLNLRKKVHTQHDITLCIFVIVLLNLFFILLLLLLPRRYMLYFTNVHIFITLSHVLSLLFLLKMFVLFLAIFFGPYQYNIYVNPWYKYSWLICRDDCTD